MAQAIASRPPVEMTAPTPEPLSPPPLEQKPPPAPAEQPPPPPADNAMHPLDHPPYPLAESATRPPHQQSPPPPAENNNDHIHVAPPLPPAHPELQATRLLWHVLHLSNILHSQLGAYLSLEALHRDATATGLIVPVAHYPLMTAQAAMMADACKNLDAAVSALERTPEHEALLREGGSYLSLMEAARGSRGVSEMVRAGVHCRRDVDALRRCYDEMVKLCYGDERNGVKGWRQAWNEICGGEDA